MISTAKQNAMKKMSKSGKKPRLTIELNAPSLMTSSTSEVVGFATTTVKKQKHQHVDQIEENVFGNEKGLASSASFLPKQKSPVTTPLGVDKNTQLKRVPPTMAQVRIDL